MKVYVATSWKNTHATEVIKRLREDGHQVYDFRDAAFSWESVGVPAQVSTDELARALLKPAAVAGYKRDMTALEKCDLCVLVLPSGKSAHLEAGYAAGEDKFLVLYAPEPTTQPELMYRFADIIVKNLAELSTAVSALSY